MSQLIDPQAADGWMRKIEKTLLSMPIEELRKVHQKMVIEAHNAEVERKKAEKKKAKAERFTFFHSSQYPDLRG